MSKALNKPKFKEHYRVEVLGKENIFLLSERGYALLNADIDKLLAPLIDGHLTVEEVIEKIQLDINLVEATFQDTISFIQDSLNMSIKARYALLQMEQKGYITENDDCLPSDLVIFCEHLNINAQEAYNRLKSTKVSVKSLGSNIPTREFITALESLQIQVSADADADMEIVLTDDYLHQGLDELNQKALSLSRPWMLVQLVGTSIWMGPIFYPRKTGCWQCLAQRLHGNRPVEGFLQRHKGISNPLTPPLATFPATIHTGVGMAATEVFKWIVRGVNEQLEGKIITYDAISLEMQRHILVKRPQCSTCGEVFNAMDRQPLPIQLGHRKKILAADGGHRCLSPEETLRRHQHHISPITGVVRELGKVFTGSDNLMHAYVARHHFATMFDDLQSLQRNIGGRSAGKGRTDQQARVSGFCEAIERYSGVFQGDELREKGSYRAMMNRAIHPNACMNFSLAQYQNRAEWNARCSSWFQYVPEPFDEEIEIEWTPVWSLTHQAFKYLPTAYCYFGYPTSSKSSCWADTNGCAAGNTLEEAILQGFMELVERDAVALWWYNRLQKPLLDLESFDEPYFQVLKQYYQQLHRELWIVDITSDLNIPTFAAISRRSDRDVEDIILGYGAHFDPVIAINRALTEVNQILPNVLFSQADGSTQYPHSADRLAIDWWQTATLKNQSYLVPDDRVVPKVCSDYTHVVTEDLLEDLELCQEIAKNNGLEILVLDQTRPDIGLKVVKVIVPGMRHMWKRLGSGRLYDIPLKMGWLQEPLAEDQLNPFPMWM